MDDHDWNLFVDLEKNEVEEVKKKYPKQWIPVKKISRNYYYLYTIDEGVEEETDFFKKSPIKEKNMYKDKFTKYKLNSK